ncbi:MAG: hypothetical protein Ct9H300mP1_14110 [Planctomycetaceae bacterium]|nr:MAG: hypothetical protein Ct9H300mP1_14110 [Planctomycetaceae bacterium]
MAHRDVRQRLAEPGFLASATSSSTPTRQSPWPPPVAGHQHAAHFSPDREALRKSLRDHRRSTRRPAGRQQRDLRLPWRDLHGECGPGHRHHGPLQRPDPTDHHPVRLQTLPLSGSSPTALPQIVGDVTLADDSTSRFSRHRHCPGNGISNACSPKVVSRTLPVRRSAWSPARPRSAISRSPMPERPASTSPTATQRAPGHDHRRRHHRGHRRCAGRHGRNQPGRSRSKTCPSAT